MIEVHSDKENVHLEQLTKALEFIYSLIFPFSPLPLVHKQNKEEIEKFENSFSQGRKKRRRKDSSYHQEAEGLFG